jgi:hypothetical protein
MSLSKNACAALRQIMLVSLIEKEHIVKFLLPEMLEKLSHFIKFLIKKSGMLVLHYVKELWSCEISTIQIFIFLQNNHTMI